MSMKCQELPLNDFVDGLLDAEARTAVAAHLDRCTDCAALAEALADTRALLQQTHPVTTSAKFKQRLTGRLHQEDLKQQGIELLARGLASVAALLRLFLARPGGGGASAAPAPLDQRADE